MTQAQRLRRILPTSRLALRARITIAFGLGALLLSMLLASIVYGLTRENLLNQRERSATDRALTNAVTVKNGLAPDQPVSDLLATLPTPEGANPLLRYQDTWTAKNEVEFPSDALSPRLQAVVLEGEPARMRYRQGDVPLLVTGVPLDTVDAFYFEGASLGDIEETLNGLAISLAGAAAITTIAGAGLGFYTSRRVLKPLAEVGEAAEAIAGGRLDARVLGSDDADLAPITTSFNDMAQALQDRIERDARFASEVSHELRSPLMTLAASLEVLQNSKDSLPDRAQAALDLLAVDIDRFQQLVEDLLEISRFDAGAVHLQTEEVLVADLVQQAVSAICGSRVPVVVESDASRMVVEADKRRIGQILANLLDNAEKYAGGATAVRVSPAGASHVRIGVEDTGHGVPREEREVIFDRFSRGSLGGRRGADLGTGLGLSLVDEHVRLHGGRVWVEDRLDARAGARFVVELPVVHALEEDLAAPMETPADGAVTP